MRSALLQRFLWANFDNAEEICVSNGGHLASIHSVEENTFVNGETSLHFLYRYLVIFSYRNKSDVFRFVEIVCI